MFPITKEKSTILKKIYSGAEEMNKKIMEISLSVVCVVLCVCCLFTGCGKSAPKSLYESNTVEVIRNGSKTAVYDLVADKQYNYIAKRVKRSKAITEPYTTVDTDTIKIDIIPSGLCVYDKSKNTVFTYQRKLRHEKG